MMVFSFSFWGLGWGVESLHSGSGMALMNVQTMDDGRHTGRRL